MLFLQVACSTLLRVYPLATNQLHHKQTYSCNLQYPPTGLYSRNRVILYLIMLVLILQYPPTGLYSCNMAMAIVILEEHRLAVPSYGSILWQLTLDDESPSPLQGLQYPPTGLYSRNLASVAVLVIMNPQLAVPSYGSILSQQ